MALGGGGQGKFGHGGLEWQINEKEERRQEDCCCHLKGAGEN